MSKNNETLDSFVPLTPIDDERIYDNYKDALDYALSKNEIHNIGLTGPYGSGKSSVIKSYESRANRGKFLNISLASFTDIQSSNEQSSPEPNKDASKQSAADIKEIEKGILQQIIFSVPHKNLPFSRLNRIREPYRPRLIVGLLSIWIVFAVLFHNEKDYFVAFEFLDSSSWMTKLWPIFFGYLLAIPALLFKDLYLSIHRMSFKEISYGKAKIVSDDFRSESVFNQFIDEIIYFFSASKIDVVVFEDIDRFNRPEIFVKLREINKIVNDHIKFNNKKTKSVKFIYLLKDSIFKEDENRAKFFDFIIPVIPIINDFNSSEKLREISKNVEVGEDIQNFLEDIAFYIYDLRLINNIFNEFHVIKKQLNASGLNSVKLLAIVVFKNTYPSDFEKLHLRDGALYKILNSKSGLIKKHKESLIKEKEELSFVKSQIDKEIAKTIDDLTNIYLGYIIRNSVSNGVGLEINGAPVYYSNIKSQFLVDFANRNSQILVIDNNGGRHTWKRFSEIENEIDSEISFRERLRNIESNEIKERCLNQLDNIQRQLENIEKRKVSDLLKEDGSKMDEALASEKIENGDLLRFMLIYGYLDEDYYLYISVFHEGAWSNNDRDFLISIKSNKDYKPDYKVDSPAEVIRRLRNDYSSKQLLNVAIFDWVLRCHSEALKEIEKYLLDHEQELKIFVDKYIEKGSQVGSFMQWISKSWINFNNYFIESSDVLALVKNTFLYVDIIDLSEKAKNKVREIIGINAGQILTAEFKWHHFEKFVDLDVKIKNIYFDGNNALVDFLVENNLYEINVDNLRFLMKEIPSDAIEERNYSSIVTCFSSIKEYIHLNIENYVNNVFLELPRNQNEDENWLIDLVDRVDNEDLQKRIIDKQVLKMADLSLVNEKLHKYLFATNKVCPNWKNFGILIDLLNHDEMQGFLKENYKELSVDKVPEDNIGPISSFVYSAVDIDDGAYKQLIDCVGYKLPAFPENCSNKKKEILIESGCLELTDKTIASVRDNNHLLILLIIENIDSYISKPFSIDAFVCKTILESRMLDRDSKLRFCYILNISDLTDVNLKTCIVEFLSEGDFDHEKLDDQFYIEIIRSSNNLDASIKLIAYLIDFKDISMIIQLINECKEPYNKIFEKKRNRSILPKNETNLNFVSKLKEKNLIRGFDIKDNDKLSIQKNRQ